MIDGQVGCLMFYLLSLMGFERHSGQARDKGSGGE